MFRIVRLYMSSALLIALIALIWPHDLMEARAAGMGVNGTVPDSSREAVTSNENKVKPSTSNSQTKSLEDDVRTNEDLEEDKLVSVIVELKNDSSGPDKGDASGLPRNDSDSKSEGKLERGSRDSGTYSSYLDQKFRAFESAVLKSIPEARIIHLFRSETGHVHIFVPVSRLNDLAKLPGVDAVFPEEFCLCY